MASEPVHHVAAKGFGEGTNELYDRVRPSYQPEAISYIRKAVRGGPHLNVVEIGSGTGIFTRALLSHSDWTGSIKTLKAIEPSKGMREQFAKTVNDDRVTLSEGTFDTTGVEDGWADIIIIAQAFHWCPDHERAASEFARILKPDGIVALIWNAANSDTAWVSQIQDRIAAQADDVPKFRTGTWRKYLDCHSYEAHFEPAEEKTWTYNLTTTIDRAVLGALTASYVAILPDDEKARVAAEVRAILKEGSGMEWEDEANGVFKYPYRTLVVISHRSSS